MDITVECIVSATDLPPDKAAALRDLIIQPRRPWFSAAERAYLDGAIEGRWAEVALNHFSTAWLNGEPVGNVTVSTARAAPQIGLLSFVFTRPDQRGRGIAATLMRDAVTRFRAAGGECLHLGTENPSARRIYAGCGFHDYNGHIMRYLASGDSDREFDQAYFASAGSAAVRPGHWGDLARIGYLYAAPHPWLIKDYTERLYRSPDVEQARVGSILPSMMVNASERHGALWVLENAAGRVVGAATVTRLDQTAQRHAPLLDFLVAPGYVGQAGELVQRAIDGLRGTDVEHVCAYLASCDGQKVEILRSAGFERVARLPRQLSVNDHHYDLEIYVRPVQ